MNIPQERAESVEMELDYVKVTRQIKSGEENKTNEI